MIVLLEVQGPCHRSDFLTHASLCVEERPRRAEVSVVILVTRTLEQILALLEGYGGRMCQQDVIDETGYSAGKVSQLFVEREENGQIARYWKHGETVVCNPDRVSKLPIN